MRPHVREMDEAGVFRKDLIQEFFKLGLMAIDVPEQYGGPSGYFFQSILAIEELARVDPSAAVIVDVQNTLFNNAIMRWANEEQKQKYLPRLAKDTVASYALSEAGSGSDAFALATRAVDAGDHFRITGRKLWITNADEAGLFLLFANVNPDAGYKGITAFLIERDFPGLQSRQERRQARHPRVFHLRADPGRLPRSQSQRDRRNRQRLQDRD